MGLTGLRRGAARAQGNNKGKGKGGYYATWTPPSLTKIEGQLRPDEVAQVAEPVVFIEGQYRDAFDPTGATQPAHHRQYHRYVHNYQGKKSYRTVTCLRGPDKHNPQPCLGCYLVDHKEWDEKSAGVKDSWVFNLAHLVPYFDAPLVKDGQIQTKRESNEPIMVTRACRQGTVADRLYWQGRGKPFCDGCSPQGCAHQRKLGGHRYWEMGSNHLNALLDFNDKVLGKIDLYTGTGIVKIGYSCSNCGQEMLNIATSGFTNDQLKQFEQEPQTCRACQAHSLPNPLYDAGYDERGMTKVAGYQPVVDPSTGQPIPPKPLSIFDVVLWIQREGENTDSKPVVTRWCRLTEAPFGDGGQPVDITQFINDTVVPNPFDFEDLFGTTTDEQAKAIQRPNPYGQQAQQQDFHRYAQQPQGGYAAPTLPPQQPYQGYSPAPQVPAPQGYPQQAPQTSMPGYPPQQQAPMPQAPVQQPPIAAPYPPQAPQAPQAAPPMPPAPQPQQAAPQAPMPPPRPNWGNNQ